jgi:hypothetical protein
LNGLEGLRQSIPSSLAHQCLGFHQRADGFFQEKGVTALDKELLERREFRIVAEESIQQLPGTLGRERVQSQLAVVRLAAPAVLVPRTVIHEQQQARRA